MEIQKKKFESFSFNPAVNGLYKNREKGVSVKEREHSVAAWLQGHETRGTGAAEKADERSRFTDIENHLKEGLALSDSPTKELMDNVMFVSPLRNEKPKKRGAAYRDVPRSVRFPAAIKTITKYDTENRWAAGLNANTLLTEYRRKVLFHALLNSHDVDEDREDSKDKVRSYLEANNPSLLANLDDSSTTEQEKNNCEMDSVKDSIDEEQDLYTFSGLLKSQYSRDAKKKVKDLETNFAPKYADYDVMSNRWSYIYPDIVALNKGTNTLIPTSTSRMHITEEGAVFGNYKEVSSYTEKCKTRRKKERKKAAATSKRNDKKTF